MVVQNVECVAILCPRKPGPVVPWLNPDPVRKSLWSCEASSEERKEGSYGVICQQQCVGNHRGDRGCAAVVGFPTYRSVLEPDTLPPSSSNTPSGKLTGEVNSTPSSLSFSLRGVRRAVAISISRGNGPMSACKFCAGDRSWRQSGSQLRRARRSDYCASRGCPKCYSGRWPPLGTPRRAGA